MAKIKLFIMVVLSNNSHLAWDMIGIVCPWRGWKITPSGKGSPYYDITLWVSDIWKQTTQKTIDTPPCDTPYKPLLYKPLDWGNSSVDYLRSKTGKKGRNNTCTSLNYEVIHMTTQVLQQSTDLITCSSPIRAVRSHSLVCSKIYF